MLIASAAISLFPNGERGPNNWVNRTAFAAAPDTPTRHLWSRYSPGTGCSYVGLFAAPAVCA